LDAVDKSITFIKDLWLILITKQILQYTSNVDIH